MRISSFLFIFFIGLAVFAGCTPSARIYHIGNGKRAYAGLLQDTTFTALKQFLIKTTNQSLRDTILINYDFNHETCWSNSDKESDEVLHDWVARSQAVTKMVYVERPALSYFRFREPGDDIPKIKKWDKEIIVDSSRRLFNMLFSERCACGSSVLIMPDRRFVFVRSDGHLQALHATAKDIQSVFDGTYDGSIFGRK